MAPKLTPEEVVTLQVLKRKGQSNTQIAQALGISEGAVRYQFELRPETDGVREVDDPVAAHAM